MGCILSFMRIFGEIDAGFSTPDINYHVPEEEFYKSEGTLNG
jgi:hypothetical protein